MLGGLYGLNSYQHAYLYLAQITPSVVTYYGLFKFNESLVTLTILQMLYLILPYLYIRYLSKEGEVQAYLIDEFRTQSQQIKQGFNLCGSAFGMVILSLLFTYFYEDELMDYLDIPLYDNIAYIIVTILILSLLNPILEEWFWRVFLMKTFRESEKYRMIINSTYALLHLVVLFKLFNNWEFALGFGCYFYSIGRSFEYIREKYGLITCLMAHYGMTIASCIVLLIVFELLE